MSLRWYYYGERFSGADRGQQVEVGRDASGRIRWASGWCSGSGRFLTIEDERMRHEDDRVRAQAQRSMSVDTGVVGVCVVCLRMGRRIVR